MKTINTSQKVLIPKDVEFKIHNRIVTVKGPRGTLKRSFQMLKLNFHVSTGIGVNVLVFELNCEEVQFGIS